MNEEIYWKVISKADTSHRKLGDIDLGPSINELSRYDEKVINGFRSFVEELYPPYETDEHIKAVKGSSDDDFYYKCLYNIAVGKDHYEESLENPEVMHPYGLEDLLYLGYEALKLKQAGFEDDEDDGWLDV